MEGDKLREKGWGILMKDRKKDDHLSAHLQDPKNQKALSSGVGAVKTRSKEHNRGCNKSEVKGLPWWLSG